MPRRPRKIKRAAPKVVAANVDKENRTIENLLNIDMNASIEILRHRQDSPVPDFSNKDSNQSPNGQSKRLFGNPRNDSNFMPIIKEDPSSQPHCTINTDGFLCSTPKDGSECNIRFLQVDLSDICSSNKHEIPKLAVISDSEEMFKLEPLSTSMQMPIKFESSSQNIRNEHNMQPLTQNSPHSGGNGHTVQNARDPAGPTKKLPREYPICPIILFDEVKFRSAPILLKGRRPQSTTSQ